MAGCRNTVKRHLEREESKNQGIKPVMKEDVFSFLISELNLNHVRTENVL